jgi:hypothetical protein
MLPHLDIIDEFYDTIKPKSPAEKKRKRAEIIMCREHVAICPECWATVTFQWKYCRPYINADPAVRSESGGLIPPVAYFVSHDLGVVQEVCSSLTPETCPNDSCPSKTPVENRGSRRLSRIT